MYSYQTYSRPNEQYIIQKGDQLLFQNQLTPSPSAIVNYQCQVISQRSANITKNELVEILDQLFQAINNIHHKKNQIRKFQDAITVLIRIQPFILASVVQHRFFTLLPTRLNTILQQWNENSSLADKQTQLFRNSVRLLKKLFSEIIEIQQYPSWFTDSALLNTIGICLTNLSNFDTLFEKNKRMTRSFINLFILYNNYQIMLYNETNIDQNKLNVFVEPIVACLKSDVYFHSFNHLQQSTKLKSRKEKFILMHCPTFITNYNGSHREQTMTNLLEKILPKYIVILDQLKPFIQQWKYPTMRAVNHLLRIVNQRSINQNVIIGHMSLIDHILTLIDTPILYNKLLDRVSSPEAKLIQTAVSLLANYINEPTVLTYIKQKNVTSSFLRLKSAKYEPLVDNIYTILAHTTSEQDIKFMENPGTLLLTVVNRLKATIEKPSDNKDQVIHLLEVLKGLVQHDQLKEEVLKQNVHLFLLQCTNQLSEQALPLLFETLWLLSFNSNLATVLRDNAELLNRVQMISKDTKDEALKKAADGLVWKLVREPEFLDKIAKKNDNQSETETKIVIGSDGKQQVVKTIKQSAAAQAERVFKYDIMISYCHADQALIKNIHKFLLEENFKVWIDLDNMFGPAMNAMADAVENSEFVLLCMSESYKRSTYCQAEAEYAFGCKRRLVPLIVRPGYRADGWLGFMIGARIYVDFGSFDFDTACEKLIIEIARQRQQPLPSKEIKATKSVENIIPNQKETISNQNETISNQKEIIPVSKEVTQVMKEEKQEDVPLFLQKLPSRYNKRDATLNFDLQYVESWSETDVQDFLYTHQLNELMPLCEKMDGQALVQLHNICLSQYHQAYHILSEQLKISYKTILPIATYAKFLSVMKRVITPPRQSIAPVPPRPMFPPIPEQLMLPPPTLLPQPNNSNSDSEYDIVVTSDAPALKMLQFIKRVGSHWHINMPGYT